VERPGYCPAHRRGRPSGFDALDRRKTDESRSFYASRRWTEASRRHRQTEPLCRRCRAAGKIVPAQMVHHNPPVEHLLSQGLSPYDDRYLESLCNNCHLEELRKKKTPRA
jgi:5-methylcytosine-specific restriction protein A